MSLSPLLAITLPTTVPLQGFLAVAAVLFCTGVWGLINSRNAVRVLMSIELMLNGVNINLMAFSSYLDGQLIRGQVFTIFVIRWRQRKRPWAWRFCSRCIATATPLTWSALICCVGSWPLPQFRLLACIAPSPLFAS